MNKKFQYLALAVIITTALTIAYTTSYYYRPKTIAIIDMPKIINTMAKELESTDSLEEDTTEIARQRASVKKLNLILKNIALEKNLIIIDSKAVFAGEILDLTGTILKEYNYDTN